MVEQENKVDPNEVMMDMDLLVECVSHQYNKSEPENEIY